MYFLHRDERNVDVSKEVAGCNEDNNALRDMTVKEEESLEISIHAIFGCQSSNAMKLGKVGD